MEHHLEGGMTALHTEAAHCSILPLREPTSPIHLHPLVILNISDHVTRARYLTHHCQSVSIQSSSSVAGSAVAYDNELVVSLAPVIGVLLGRLQDGKVEVSTSYEAVFHDSTDESKATMQPGYDTTSKPTLGEKTGLVPEHVASMLTERHGYAEMVDVNALQCHRDRMAEVFPGDDVVGWYTVGVHVSDLLCCASYHQRLCELFRKNPMPPMIALLLDPQPTASDSRLPFWLFEVSSTTTVVPRSVADNESGDGSSIFIRAEGGGKAMGEGQFVEQQLPPVGHSGHVTLHLQKVRYSLTSEDAEQTVFDATVDAAMPPPSHLSATAHLAQPQPYVWTNSGVHLTFTSEKHLRVRMYRIRRSLHLFKRRLQLIILYLESINMGRINHWDRSVLRDIARIALHLPSVSIIYDKDTRSALTTELNNMMHMQPASVTPSISESVIQNELQKTLTTSLLTIQTVCSVKLRQLRMSDMHGLSWLSQLRCQDGSKRFT